MGYFYSPYSIGGSSESPMTLDYTQSQSSNRRRGTYKSQQRKSRSNWFKISKQIFEDNQFYDEFMADHDTKFTKKSTFAHQNVDFSTLSAQNDDL